MIDPKELRLGNLVKYFDTKECICIYEIQCRYEDTYSINDINNNKLIEPIELTEEWLLKFGFEKENDYMYSINKGTVDYFPLWIFSDGIYFCRLSKPIKLKYVHKLQNLYFELREKELIK